MSGREYRASAALEALILRMAPAHYPTPDAPSTFDGLQAAFAAGGPLPVFDGGCEKTIYSRPEVNHAFRAWHDSIHVSAGAGFDRTGEHAVAMAHCKAAGDAGLPMADWLALYFDVWGQFLYASLHGGEFPRNQAAFVQACFDDGLPRAVSRNF